MCRPTQGKLDFVDKFPVPTNGKDLNSFLGFANYLRKFVKNFSLIADPLFKLRNVKNFIWSEKEEKAFQELKLSIKNAEFMHLPSESKDFVVVTDFGNRRLQRYCG